MLNSKIFFTCITGESEEKKTSDINRYLQQTFNISHKVPTMFVDNYPDLSDVKQQNKLKAVKDGLGTLAESTSRYCPYE